MIRDTICDVLDNRRVGPECYEILLRPRADVEWMPSLRSGHFFELKVTPEPDPFLRRPFSVFDVLEDSFSILYILHGRGTRVMSRLQRGNAVEILGPLGNVFDTAPPAKKHVMIAGGIGIAPFLLLAQQLLDAGTNPGDIQLLFGARSTDMLYSLDRFESLGLDCRVITDNGSSGRQGFVTDLLRETLAETPAGARGYCCGPTPMFRAVQKVMADFPEFHCQFTLESFMACGMGVCNVCAVEHLDHPEKYLKVCTHGPVFDGRKLVFSQSFK